MGCKPVTHANRVFVIQPLGDISPALVNNVYRNLKNINPHAILSIAVPLPASAYFQPRNRYRADSLLDFLRKKGNADTVIVGLTNRDISTTKGNIADWGVMGLCRQPGDACVVSTFRLNPTRLNVQFYKVILHELGHTAGLPHCPDPHCLMRDAEGGNHLDEETGFCPKCNAYLHSKGWKLQPVINL